MGFLDKAKMAAQARKIQKELKSILIESEKLDGKVKVVLNGEGKVEEIHLDPAVSHREAETFLKQAFNEAFAKLSQISAEKMKEIYGDLNLPF